MNYEFFNMPLTKTVAESLILELYSDVKSYVRREDVAKTVIETHLERGGLEALKKDPVRNAIKPALSNLEKSGLALNRDKSVGYGYWIFCEDFTPEMPYSGMTLIPTLAKEMIVELFSGKTVHRSEIVETLTRVHSERGGEPSNETSIISVVKKAGTTLKKEGLVDQSVIGKGIWTVHLDPVSPQPSAAVIRSEEPADYDTTPDSALKRAFQAATGNAVLDAGKTIGNGEDCVYVYYYPTFRNYAELHGKTVFACKVGSTTNTAFERVQSQLNESTCEYPVIGLTIRTNNRLTLEQLIHKHLELHGKVLDTAHGKEWFITSPAEVERIYKGIMKI